MGMFTVLMTLIGGAVFAALIITISREFDEDWLTRILKGAIGAGVFIATGLLVPVVPAAAGLAMVVLPIAVFAYLFYWWAENGSTIKELLIFVLMGIMLYFQAMSAVVRLFDLTDSWVLRGLAKSVPKLIFIALIAFSISNMIKFRMELEDVAREGGEDDDDYDEE